MMERQLAEWEKVLEGGEKPVGMLMKPGKHWHLMRTLSSEMESGRINLAHIEKQFGLPVRALTEDVIAQWIDAGLMHRVDDWLAQLLIGLVGMRLGAGAVHERPAGNAAVFSGEKPAHG